MKWFIGVAAAVILPDLAGDISALAWLVTTLALIGVPCGVYLYAFFATEHKGDVDAMSDHKRKLRALEKAVLARSGLR